MSGPETHRGVLVGVDRSASSMAAVDWAARDAAMRNVPLTLMHVIAPVVPALAPWPEIPIPQDYFEQQEDRARRILEDARRVVADSTADHPPPLVHSAVVHGPAVSTLVNESKIADLMVVGCRGEGAFGQASFGSVSTGLVNYAHCPVAVVHDEAPTPAAAPVLVGIDGSHASERATEIAFDEASRRGVDLVALHAWSDVSLSEVPGLDFEAMEVQAQDALAAWLARWQERYPGVTVRRVVVRDEPARQLVEHSESAQLVVVGSSGRGGFAGMLLGSVSTAVTHAARTVVIVAREP
ncbi:universal stress protein [Mycobacterium sp. SMC-2]|uniref:universal stress protein n=1 Tax=Mycobacterium sp. SMC-2 TaxID=2857058 RepID=UPI0021B422D1|nr:universal stress protein [Mycobacterium sp. SMC-2]UXA08323.1 universal stress protein [Mycobacterium sp. SMC-2]